MEELFKNNFSMRLERISNGVTFNILEIFGADEGLFQNWGCWERTYELATVFSV